ncbi:GH25 family lysozyme [Lacticaseibacillus porcinae]|uniref:GH25 family lysozyme n=1 Tax=Lacticaseibacillus porcinae TaxID=1123687 RepID=UPI000F77147D|nr:GH25 family lysozyme [Lacticaseibacillus porcinae]
MKLNRQSKSVLGIAGLFSALLLTNMQQPAEVHAISQSAPSQAVDTTGQQKQSTVILKSSQQVDAAAQVADAAFQLTNGHSNESEESTSNRSLGAIINDQALWAMTDESGSTSTRHVMKMPTSLDTDTAATWLTLAKKQGQIDQQKTGRQQQIIMVAATAQNTLEFAIGNTSVPHVDAVDVSSYQSWMTQAQYTQLKQLGVKTVIIKISESTNYSNPYAASQIKYAEAAGLNVAVYHFARFGNTATAQAEAKKTIQVLNSLGLPTSTLVFADMEGAETNVSSVGTNLNQYWKTMSAGGYMNHGVYTGGLYGAGYAAATSGTVGAARTWYAHYPTTPSKNNLLEKNYGAWQFSSTSYLPGFTGKFIDASTDYVGLFSK